MTRRFSFLIAAGVTAVLASSATAEPRPLSSFQERAERFGARLTLPEFETTPAAVVASCDEAIDASERAIARIASQDLGAVSFESVFAALDDGLYPVINCVNRMWLIKETSEDAAVREACTAQTTRISQWFVEQQYREDLYEACAAFQEAYEDGERGELTGADLKLYEDTMRDYRRAGMHLNEETRREVESLQKRLTELSTAFSTNITNADVDVMFTREELNGVPESFLSRLKPERGVYTLKATVITHFLAVMENAHSEEARKRMKTARYSVAQAENGPLLDQIVSLRDEIATMLGYDSWADYKIEPKMAGTGDEALTFLLDMKRGLEPKFQAEKDAFSDMKSEDTGVAGAQVRIWDWRYYTNRLMKERYDIDSEALRAYFPLERVQAGMFRIYETLFGLEFSEIEPPYVWTEGLQLWLASDAATGEPMGLFYLDLYPRPGKYNHFAQFGIIDGKQLDDGTYQRPVVSLVCNFTPPSGDTPSLLTHDEVTTYFHEFGHALHSILTRAEYAQQSGTSVERDFVEAPSQMLERWCWDPDVVNTYAAHWQDESKKIDPAILERMEEARLATIGNHYRRQLSFGIGDLRLHAKGRDKDCQKILNDTIREVFYAPPAGTNFGAYWGHLTGYDAGYYGYAWADAIAADMAMAFRNSEGGWMDTEVGMRLREEIYAPGGSRDAAESIRAFLGRERSIDPFLESIGIEE